MINVCTWYVSGLDSPMIICRMVLPITFVRKWRKEEEPARGFIAPQGINSSVPAPISLSEGEEASYGSFAISAPAECCNLSHCHDATALALDGPCNLLSGFFTVWLQGFTQDMKYWDDEWTANLWSKFWFSLINFQLSQPCSNDTLCALLQLRGRHSTLQIEPAQNILYVWEIVC